MSAPDATKPVGAGSVLCGRYRLIRLIAQGGMASVWEGHDNVLARAVAVKMLHPHLASDRQFLERFRREAVSAARLAHPNVVATFDAGLTPEGTAFIVMELIRGRTLSAFEADHRPLPNFVCIEIGMQIADALAHAHRAGLVHRDIKPANVLVCDTDVEGVPLVKVTDFGIAKATEGLGLDLTKTGMVLGTPKYLSPEQIEGREPDARADLYALGVVLFELEAGITPFRGPTEMAVAVQHLNDIPARLRDLRPNVPPAMDALVAQLLAKRPEDRPPSALAVRRALAGIDVRGRPAQPGAPSANGGAVATSVFQPSPPQAAPPGSSPSGPTPPRAAPSQPPPPVAGGAPRPGSSWPPPGPAPSPPVAPVAPVTPWPGRPQAAAPRSAPGTPLGQPGPYWPAQPRPSSSPAPGSPGGLPRRSGPAPTGALPGARPPRGSATATGPTGGSARPPQSRSRPARRPNWTGRLVAGLVVAALIVVIAVVASHGSGGLPRLSTSTTVASSPVQFQSASVFHLERDADDEANVGYAIDGKIDTAWETDHYFTPDFGGLRPQGLGLALTLDATDTLHHLTVTSSTVGWSAEVFVASGVPSPPSLSAWGAPVASQQDINGSTVFNLAGRKGSAVLLWITYLGTTNQVSIAEVSTS